MQPRGRGSVMSSRIEPTAEIWVSVPGWPGYEVSDRGRVRSWKWPGKMRAWVEDRSRSPRVLRPDVRNGYLGVLLSDKDRGRRHVNIHVLVLEAFVGPRPEGMQVAHTNGERHDNRIENLRWATPSSNNADKHAHGTHQHGERIGSAKLTATDVHEIVTLRRDGVGVARLADKFGVCRNTITNITTGRAWRGVTNAS